MSLGGEGSLTEPPSDMAWTPGGTYVMGSDMVDYPEESPLHPVTVNGFWIDATPVTVESFTGFVEATAYITVAERPINPAEYPLLDPALLVPGSMVFTPTPRPVDLTNFTNWWRFEPGASWSHPEGPQSDIQGREHHPVTHVAWEDVKAYASWAGKELPTEAEWERAARGGLDAATYAWGDDLEPAGRAMANIWVGEFPWQNLKPLADQRTTVVGSYPPNGFGLFDVTGNVWEWTADFYQPHHDQPIGHGCCVPQNPRVDRTDRSYDASEPGGAHIPRRVVKGGSHLCALNYCRRYRPAARQAQQLDSSMSHLGFRCIRRDLPGPG